MKKNIIRSLAFSLVVNFILLSGGLISYSHIVREQATRSWVVFGLCKQPVWWAGGLPLNFFRRGCYGEFPIKVNFWTLVFDIFFWSLVVYSVIRVRKK